MTIVATEIILKYILQPQPENFGQKVTGIDRFYYTCCRVCVSAGSIIKKIDW